MNDYYYPELTRIQMLDDVPKWIFKKAEGAQWLHNVKLLSKAQLLLGGERLTVTGFSVPS